MPFLCHAAGAVSSHCPSQQTFYPGGKRESCGPGSSLLKQATKVICHLPLTSVSRLRGMCKLCIGLTSCFCRNNHPLVYMEDSSRTPEYTKTHAYSSATVGSTEPTYVINQPSMYTGFTSCQYCIFNLHG